MADASPLSASVIIILRRTNSGSFTDRQRKRVRERDCRRRAQIKTPPNPIRDGNCVRSSGPAIGRLLGVDREGRGWLADYIPETRGVTQSSSPVRTRAHSRLLVSLRI